MDIKSLENCDFLLNDKLNLVFLDNCFANVFDSQSEDNKVSKILNGLNKLSAFTVAELASDLNMSSKTLERATKKYFNLTPKELWNVLRFEKTTRPLKKGSNQKFKDVLSFATTTNLTLLKIAKRLPELLLKNFSLE